MSTDVVTTATETHAPTVDAPAAGDPRTSASVRTPLQQVTNRTRWLWKRLEEVFGKVAPISTVIPVAVESASTTTDALTLTGHGLVNGDAVRLLFIGAAVAPTGLAAGTIYFVVGATADTVQLAATSGGAAIDLTGAGSGTFYLVRVDDPEIYLPTVSTVVFGKLSAILARFATLAGNNTWSGINTWGGNTVYSGSGTISVDQAMTLAANRHVGLSSRSVTRSAASMFTRVSDALAFTGLVVVPATDQAQTVLNLPHGATLTKVSWGHDPNNASPPAGTKVVGEVYKRHLTTGALTLIVSTTDPTSGGSYGASHLFDSAAISEVIDRTTYAYLALLTGETGAGSDFSTWWGLTWTATLTGIDDGVA